jgi:hypothetical protein
MVCDGAAGINALRPAWVDLVTLFDLEHLAAAFAVRDLKSLR